MTQPELQKMDAEVIDVQALKQAGVVGQMVRYAKVIKSGELSRKVALKGINATAGARAAIISGTAPRSRPALPHSSPRRIQPFCRWF